jgi:hypothetical protein
MVGQGKDTTKKYGSGNEIPLVSHSKCVIALHSSVNILSVPQLGRSPFGACLPGEDSTVERLQEGGSGPFNGGEAFAAQHGGVLTKEEYRVAYADTERLGMAARLAEEALSHVAGHGC